jgi:glycosyltransferase involved in cell wall biosynthesis
MFILVDALPLQGPQPTEHGTGRSVIDLLRNLRAERPGWRIELLERGYLPPARGQAGRFRVRTFTPPLPISPETREANELYLADWVTAQRPDWVVHAGAFRQDGLLPRYGTSRPRVAAVACDPLPLPSEDDAAGWSAGRLRFLFGMDLLLTDSAAIASELRRLGGPRCPVVVSLGSSRPRTVVEAIERADKVPAAPAGKPRVAWVSPLPPSGSGIADYSADVLPHLADRFDIELVTDKMEVRTDLARRFPVVTADEVPARDAARPFDLFLYHVGNSTAHTYMLPLLVRYPGLVVLHDFHLGGLIREGRAERVAHLDLADEADRGGDSQFAGWARAGWLGDIPLTELAPLNRRVLEAAEAVVVHSGWAWERVRRATAAPVAVVPHVAVDPGVIRRDVERRRLGLPAGEFVVATLGRVGPSKRVPSVVRAAAGLPGPLQARTRVLVVGEADPADAADVRAAADRAGFAGRLDFRGRVPLADFPRYAVAADVAVQLRYPSRGETSGALLRALAAGAACVTSDSGAMAELPDTVTWKVRSPSWEVADLTAQLRELADRPDLRDRLGAAARRYVLDAHGPRTVAAHYAAAISEAARRRTAAGLWVRAVANALAAVPGGPPPGLIDDWARLWALAEQPAHRHHGRQAA